MSADVINLCGVYTHPNPSNTTSQAIRYFISLRETDGRKVLTAKTEYGDGRQSTDEIHFDEIDKPESRISLTLRTLARLKSQWSFEAEYPLEQAPNSDRVFEFDLSYEIDRFFDDTSRSEGQPEFVILAGGVCTGKSMIRREKFADYLVIDAGEVFLNLSRDEYFEFGEIFEEPLDLIGSAIAYRAINERRNIVTEIVGADSDATRKLLDAIVAAGYKPTMNLLHCNIETAMERNINRGNNISAHYCEPYHIRWILEAFDRVGNSEQESNLEDGEDIIDEPYFDQAFFPIRADEDYLKFELLAFTRKILSEYALSPDQIRKVSSFLLGLERLPRTTAGLNVRLSVIERVGGDTSYYDIELSEARFAISSGGYVHTPDIGGDSFSSTLFECESSGFRDGSIDPWNLSAWMLTALELLSVGGKIEVSEDSDDKIEWETEFERDAFEELEDRIKRWNQYLDEG